MTVAHHTERCELLLIATLFLLVSLVTGSGEDCKE